MTTEHSKLLSEVIKEVVLEYAKMAETGEAPPETFISGYCGLRLHQELGWNVRIEFPARDFTPWRLDRDQLADLSRNFRIDLVAFAKSTDAPNKHVEALVEFKLWTDHIKVKNDIARLRELAVTISAKQEKEIEAYVVCLPHYRTLDKVSQAISHFANHFKFANGVELPQPFATTGGNDGPGAGVVIVDAYDSEPPTKL